MSHELCYEIVNGPSKFDLMMGLFDERSMWRSVSFGLGYEKNGGMLSPIQTVTVSIKEVGRSGYEDEMWSFRAETVVWHSRPNALHFSPSPEGTIVVGTFSTKTRKGELRFLTEQELTPLEGG